MTLRYALAASLLVIVALALLASAAGARAVSSPGATSTGLATALVHYVSDIVPVVVPVAGPQGTRREMSADRPQVDTSSASSVGRITSTRPVTNPWQLLATIPGAIIKDLSFPTAQTGYAAAELGQVWKTTDGGTTWTRIVNIGYPYYWYGVYAFDASTVAVSGFINNNQSGVVRWSTDGGTTWTPDLVLTTQGWSFRVRFADALRGIVFDGIVFQGPSRAHYTTNGGRTAADWTTVIPSQNSGWFGNQFSLLPSLTARASGIHYCTSPDAGATWTCRPSIDPVFDGPVFFADEQAGWIGGGQISAPVSGWVHRTTDGGTTWSGRTLDSPWPIREIRFLDSQIGWAAGGDYYSGVGGLYFTSDGGQTWAQDISTGAEMDACDTQPFGGGQQVWCIGYTQVGGTASKVYSLTYGGSTPTPAVTVTQTPTSQATSTATNTPTNTQPPATGTTTNTALPTETTTTEPTATPTACLIEFTDVPPTNTFYPFVRCLACKSIISGYPCGGQYEPCDPSNNPYFRPNNYVTRGQLSKIVSISAGFSEPIPSTQQSFEDVPPASPFWEHVERLYARGVIGGYQCGVDPNEPCIPPENRPYFRPSNGATRGQLTKIVSESAGFDDTIPPDQYTFADVMPGSTFWVYVERLLLNRPGAMSGYPCGQIPSEPCDSENRPYFRPGNPLTRGQTSKIVANTFLPSCNTPTGP